MASRPGALKPNRYPAFTVASNRDDTPAVDPGACIAERFEVERLAGAGGMGSVYRAKDRETGGTAAVKVLDKQGKVDQERFEREALFLADLEHPAIVRYLAHGTTAEGQRYLA